MILGNPITLGGAKKKGRLPDEYQEVQYLEGTGTQYIDLNYGTTREDVIEIEFSVGSYQSSNYSFGIFGGRTSATQNNLGLSFGSTGFVSLDYGDYSVNRITISNVIAGLIHTVRITNQAFVLDGLGHQLSAVANFTTPKTFLFSVYNAYSTPMNGFIRKFMIEGKRIVIPCYRKVDSKPGAYDLAGSICPLTNTPFYVNAGTGDFIVGPDVN